MTCAIGAEFLRWEVATAAAGLLMGINPFDEPNVQQAKDATTALLEEVPVHRHAPVREPHGDIERVRLTLSAAAEQELARRRRRALSARVLRGGDYLGLLAYLPPDREPFDSALQGIRAAVGKASGCATMFGYGPTLSPLHRPAA